MKLIFTINAFFFSLLPPLKVHIGQMLLTSSCGSIAAFVYNMLQIPPQ